MNAISINIPAIPTETINELEQQHQLLAEAEVQAIEALRKKYAPLAKHNGWIKIGAIHRGDQNWSDTENFYYEVDGARIKGLLALDAFEEPNDDEFTGRSTGSRVYLTEKGQWLKITQTGYWSSWQGATTAWACGSDIIPSEADEYNFSGSIETITDEEFARAYKLESICKELGESLTTLVKKLPERLTRLRQRSEAAAQLLAALK